MQQGDVIAETTSIPFATGNNKFQQEQCPNGVVVISQTCHVIRAQHIQVAKIVDLQGHDRDEASTGKRPQYAPLTVNGKLQFADFGSIATLERTETLNTMLGEAQNALPSPQEQRLFRDLISRRFGRFPFPDAVVEWCRPLRDRIAPKATKIGAQGQLLQEITCVRIEDGNDWAESSDHNLLLSFLVAPGILPTIDEEDLNQAGSLPQNASATDKAQDIAAVIIQIRDSPCKMDSLEINQLWHRLVCAWVSTCNEKYRPEENGGIEVTGGAEILSEDEYTFDRYRISEQLDLDYLSRPVQD